MGPLDLPEEAEGAYETLLFQELMAVNHYLDPGYSLFYWRTSNNYEVDFVLYGEKGIKAFEVKRTANRRCQVNYFYLFLFLMNPISVIKKAQ